MMTEFRDGGEYENMQSEKWQKTLRGVLCRPYCGGKTGARRGLWTAPLRTDGAVKGAPHWL